MRTPGGYDAIETQARLGGFMDLVTGKSILDAVTSSKNPDPAVPLPKKVGLRKFDWGKAIDKEQKKQLSKAERLRQTLDLNMARDITDQSAEGSQSVAQSLQKAAPWVLGAAGVLLALYLMKRRK